MKKHFIIAVFFGAISLYLSFINLGFEYEYAGGDAGAVCIFPLKALCQSVFSWYEMCNGGMDGTINLPRLFPFLTVISSLNFIGISTSIIQRLLFSLYIFIPALSMFCLLSYLLKEDFGGRLVILSLGSLFYALNHFTMIILSHPVGLGELFVFYLVLPLLFLVFIKGLKGEKVIKQALLFGLLFMISLPGNMAYTGLVVLLLGSYFLWCVVMQKNYNQMFKFIGYAAGFSILFSFWFIVPFGNFILSNKENVTQSFWLGDIWYLRLLNKRNSLGNVLALSGEVWNNPQDIASLKPLHDSLLYIGLKYVIPLLSFSALFWYKRKKELTFFSLLAIIMLFLAKGINPPFGGVFLYLYNHIPGFSIYRNAYDKFSVLIAFSYAVLIAISLSYLVRHISKRIIRGGLYTVVSAAIIVSGGLFWQGKVVRWPNFLVRIPNSYYAAQQWVNSQKEDSKVLTFPMVSRRMKKLDWGYMGVDLFELLFNKPIFNYGDLSQKLGGANDWLLKEEHFSIIAKIFNIRYLLLDINHIKLVKREDLQVKNAVKVYQDIFENRLSQFLSKEAIFNGVRFYKIREDFYLPHIYASFAPAVIIGDFSILEHLCFERYLGKRPLLIFSEQNKGLIKNTEIIKQARLFASINKRLSRQLLNRIKAGLIYFMTRDIWQREFYCQEDGKYLVSCKLKPKFVFKKVFPSKIIDFSDTKDKFILAKKNNADGEYLFDGLTRLIISAYFDGDKFEDEYLQIKIKDLDIDLIKFPSVVLEYKLEDPAVQIIEMVIGVDIDGDGKADEHLKGLYQRSSTQEFYKFYANVYRRVKAKYPHLKKAVVKEIELYPHKYWKIDCSKPPKEKLYRFWIKKIEFYKGCKKKNALKIENVGFEESFANAESFLTRLTSSKNIKIVRELNKLDVARCPFMELDYKVGEMSNTGLDIIFEFTAKNSGITKIVKLKSIFPWQGNLCKETVDISRIMHKNGLDMQIWTLEKVTFNFYKKKPNEEKIEVFLKKLRFYGIDYIKDGRFAVNKAIATVDNQNILLKRSFKNAEAVKGGIELSEEVYLEKGLHRFTNLIRDWDLFKLEWVFIAPVFIERPILKQADSLPEINFRKINPTKYEVQINGAVEPFWLVFSESFHKQWRLYSRQTGNGRWETEDEIIGDYPKLGVKEAKYSMKFTPGDIKYLFKKPLEAKHHLVNGYANGWYIEPEKLELPEDFKLVLYFSPQGLFYLGLGVSGLTFLGCLGYLGWGWKRRKRQ